LAAIAIPNYLKAVKKTEGMEVVWVIKEFAKAQKMYHLTYGEYPLTLDQLPVDLSNIGHFKRVSDTGVAWVGKWSLIINQNTKNACAYSQRNDSFNKIVICGDLNMYQPNTITCRTSADMEDDSFCRSLGGVEYNPKRTYCGWGPGESCLNLGNL
ncbi:MAG: hypothetical protein LBG46_05080, partial [Elusimicrobiota bacterium]|nr:hypothetical protein [Elusimicrobiota bacterium]